MRYLVVVGFGLCVFMSWVIYMVWMPNPVKDITFFGAIFFCVAPVLLFGPLSASCLFRIYVPLPAVVFDRSGVSISRFIKMGTVIARDQITDIKEDILKFRRGYMPIVRFANKAGITPNFVQIMSLPVSKE